jgi:hypothetical protein
VRALASISTVDLGMHSQVRETLPESIRDSREDAKRIMDGSLCQQNQRTAFVDFGGTTECRTEALLVRIFPSARFNGATVLHAAASDEDEQT